jgi:hypothetical protein
VAQVGPGVDSGHNQIDGRFDHAQHGQRHAVGRRAVDRHGLDPTVQRDGLGADRAMERFDVPAGGPVAVGGDDGDVTEFLKSLCKREEPGGVHAVVVGD